jgi:hypothetical protein
MKEQQERLFALPEWISKESWDGFVEMRRFKKIPFTERARTCIINKLWRLKGQGNDVNEVLDQSNIHGWLDVYPVMDKNTNGNGHKNGKLSLYEAIRESERANGAD